MALPFVWEVPAVTIAATLFTSFERPHEGQADGSCSVRETLVRLKGATCAAVVRVTDFGATLAPHSEQKASSSLTTALQTGQFMSLF